MPEHVAQPEIPNIFTVDLEEWFCFRDRGIPNYRDWERHESRVEIGTRTILKILAEHRIEATFFVLGWVAQRHPDLIREVAEAGHEIATHGYSHAMLTQMTPDQFRRDLERALKATERAAGTTIEGFRAPRFSVIRDTLWSIDILREMGIRYDSSVFPYAGHPDYGIVDAPLDIHSHDNGIIEIPMSCAVVAGRRIPCGGGGYFRIMPYFMTRRLIDACHRDGRGVMFYIHPWELDPRQPRIASGRMDRFRHYQNLESVERKITMLLRDFRFTSIRGSLQQRLPPSAPPAIVLEKRPEQLRLPVGYLAFRRVLEILLIVSTLPITLAICAITAAAIAIGSPGPVLFRQNRKGKGGEIFRIIKFRSMYVGDDSGALPTAHADPRVTPFGHFIRRRRIDELPQLWNILKGDMSLIGPRPEPFPLAVRYEQSYPLYALRYMVRPGLTGWAQVTQGHTAELDEIGIKLKHDFHYIINISPRLDLLIVLKTVGALLTGFGGR
ncbi:MAG: polysaccharide deacetylase and domain protein [Chlorobi bacterium]|nr:polysaccharide deacetylase and domain protein [Chlorobiota bacterium]